LLQKTNILASKPFEKANDEMMKKANFDEAQR
jgi:hypothetical protein